METDYHLQITFSGDLQYKPIHKVLQIELYNSVRELLINVAKHADTYTVCLSIYRKADSMVIEVEDDGVGFDADSILDNSNLNAFGLYTIRRRTMLMDGCLEIVSKPGSGTVVTITVPLATQSVTRTTEEVEP